VNQLDMKESNKQNIFSAIRLTPGISRAQIAKKYRYSKTTVSILVEELISQGYVTDGGLVQETTHSGRKPTRLFIDQTKHCLVIVNWTERMLVISRADLSGNISDIERVPLNNSEANGKFVIKNVQEYIQKMHMVTICTICFILPAIIDESLEEISSSILNKAEMQSFIKDAKTVFHGYRIAFYNDTACLAYAEQQLGKYDASDSCLYVNINSGIGAVYIIGGKMLGGASGRTTQLGHFSIDRNGYPCECGGHGCLEKCVGEKVLRRRAEECGASHIFEHVEPLRFCDVGEMAKRENPGALKLIELLAGDLGFVLANMITVIAVKYVILGGYARNLGDYFLECIRRSVEGVGYQPFVQDATFVYAQQNEDCILKGAALYYMDHCYFI
jgi:transcriptional regulator of PTS gene